MSTIACRAGAAAWTVISTSTLLLESDGVMITDKPKVWKSRKPRKISLPPEPPRTSTIEAVDSAGHVVEHWLPRKFKLWHRPGDHYWTWPEIVRWAMDKGCTLRHRHVPGQGGDRGDR